MLNLAIEAGLPLIKIITDDLINLDAVLTEIAGTEVVEIDESYLVETTNTNTKFQWNDGVDIRYAISPETIDCRYIYNFCVEHDKILIVVNPMDTDPSMFDAGILSLPPEMLQAFLGELVDEDHIEAIAPALGLANLRISANAA